MGSDRRSSSRKHVSEKIKNEETRTNLQSERKFMDKIDDLDNVDFISSNVHSSRKEAWLYDQDDHKGRSPTMRHVSRTHRVALDSINLDPKIQIKYTDTKNQLADMLTK